MPDSRVTKKAKLMELGFVWLAFVNIKSVSITRTALDRFNRTDLSSLTAYTQAHIHQMLPVIYTR
jgi:hypothetical protein